MNNLNNICEDMSSALYSQLQSELSILTHKTEIDLDNQINDQLYNIMTNSLGGQLFSELDSILIKKIK